MILHLTIRRAPRTKRRGKMTGVIYLHRHPFKKKQVIVMDINHYKNLRRQIIVLQNKLYKIKRFCGDIKVKPERIS